MPESDDTRLQSGAHALADAAPGSSRVACAARGQRKGSRGPAGITELSALRRDGHDALTDAPLAAGLVWASVQAMAAEATPYTTEPPAARSAQLNRQVGAVGVF